MSIQPLVVVLAVAAVLLAVMLVRQVRGARTAHRSHRKPPRAEREVRVKADEPASPPPPRSSRSRPSHHRSAPEASAKSEPKPASLPRFRLEEDETLELTKVTVATEDRYEPETQQFERGVIPIVYDDEAALDEPTAAMAFILLSGVGQSDRGKRRKKNEDRFVVRPDHALFLVCDGMGGYAGGEIASEIAAEVVTDCICEGTSDAGAYQALPKRARLLVNAIQLANQRVHEAAEADPALSEMGTTLVCAQFSPNKQRVYIGHVGDSRCYLLREGTLKQITSDHTASAQGVPGSFGAMLTRAIGIRPNVIVDLVLGKPRPGDYYLLCSDGLTKMISDERIEALIMAHPHPAEASAALVEAANEAGGKDNVTVIVVRVDTPSRMPRAST